MQTHGRIFLCYIILQNRASSPHHETFSRIYAAGNYRGRESVLRAEASHYHHVCSMPLLFLSLIVAATVSGTRSALALGDGKIPKHPFEHEI